MAKTYLTRTSITVYAPSDPAGSPIVRMTTSGDIVLPFMSKFWELDELEDFLGPENYKKWMEGECDFVVMM